MERICRRSPSTVEQRSSTTPGDLVVDFGGVYQSWCVAFGIVIVSEQGRRHRRKLAMICTGWSAILDYDLPSSQVSPYEVTTPRILARACARLTLSRLPAAITMGSPMKWIWSASSLTLATTAWRAVQANRVFDSNPGTTPLQRFLPSRGTQSSSIQNKEKGKAC